ncbi:MAG: 2-oxo acid dehydrogenase subunit E2 [Dehalococcoidales bacterium]|nr:2-oxo acid dehydrogenase subunit E2 [Dehalococcoidales bacterium]
MPVAVVMPKLGWIMEAGSLVKWLKMDGETVKAGEVLFSVESDKAVSEVEALEDGVLRIPPDSPPAGEQVPVGSVLAYLVRPGESASFTALTVPAAMADAGPPATSHLAPADEWVVAGRKCSDTRPISPRARRLAAELGVDWAVIAGSGRTGRIVEHDVRAAAGSRAAGIRVSPLARRLAEEADVDLVELAARAEGKRITREDVEAAIRERSVAIAPPAAKRPTPEVAEPDAVAPGQAEREPLSAVRRITRDRMAAASRTAAPVTLMTDADATEIVALRSRLVQAAQKRLKLQPPTYNDMLVCLVAAALREHPHLNSSLEGDVLVRHKGINIGLAMDTPRGLIVPVVTDADEKGLWTIAGETARLVAQAKAGTVSAEDLRGGTFTVTNLGGFDVKAFTPILNLPECAVLGVGKIALRPVVDTSGERVIPRHMVTLSLTFDHRVVDGAPAARFLQTVKGFVEEPLLWLAT